MRHGKAKFQTKQLIALALYYLMLKKSFDDITVKDICLKAGISRMTFYRYYDKKEDIFVEYCDARFEEFFSTIRSVSIPTMADFLLYVFTFFKRYSRQLMTLKKAGKEELLIPQFTSYVSYILAKIKSIKEQTRLIGKYTAGFLAGGFFNILIIWLDEGMKESPEQMRDSVMFIIKSK